MDRVAAERASRTGADNVMSKKAQTIFLTVLVLILGALAWWLNSALDQVTSANAKKRVKPAEEQTR